MRILAFLFALLQGATLAAQELGPEELVKKVTAEVLDAINSDKALQAGDRDKALALAEEKIMPFVDFREATRLASGRTWNSATAAQQERLVSEFRAMLVRIYSNAIDAYRGQTMRVQPLKMAPGDTDVTVRNQFLRSGSRPVAVEYGMRKTPEGWKIYDITVEGISLVLTYRSEFEQIVRSSGVDGLVKALATKNRPPAQDGR